MFYRWSVVLALVLVVAAGVSLTGETVRIALVADVHAHDTDSPVQHKVMVNWAERLTVFVDAANDWSADAIIDLGDLVNGRFVMGAELGDAARIPGILAQTVAVLAEFDGPVHHVIGNHDVYDLYKAEFLAGTGQEFTYYSFDLGGFHFVILDAQFDKQGNDYGHVGWMVQGFIPATQLEWLQSTLAATDLPTLVFIHQPLDSDFSMLAGGPPVFNHLAVRDILTADGDVIAVFQGHSHQDNYSEIDGIHYLTIAAILDHTEPTPLTWAMMTLDATAGTILIDGVGIQPDLELSF